MKLKYNLLITIISTTIVLALTLNNVHTLIEDRIVVTLIIMCSLIALINFLLAVGKLYVDVSIYFQIKKENPNKSFKEIIKLIEKLNS